MKPLPLLRRSGTCLALSAVLLVAVLIGSSYLTGLHHWVPGQDWGGDMKQHWTAARMVAETGFPSLYRDFAFSREITRDFHADNYAAGQFLDRHDYRYGPLVAWVAWFLRPLPYSLWLAGWFFLSLALTIAGWWCLRKTWPQQTSGPGSWIALAAFPPTLYAFSIYQNAPLTFGIICPSLLLASHGFAGWSGALLACAHYKPQILAFLFAGLLMARQWRAAILMATVSAALLILGLALAGWEAHHAWVESLLNIMQGRQGDEMATNIPWRGFLATCLPHLAPATVSQLSNGLLLISAAALFAWFQRERSHHRNVRLEDALAVTIGWWLVFSPHVKPYDLLLAFPATVVLLNRSANRHASWAWITLWTAAFLGVFARLIGPSLAALPLTVWWILLLAPQRPPSSTLHLTSLPANARS
ncbi:MAG: glycosyltransferase family 87 protein [Verrucomicrobiia bacterium]